MTMPTGVDGCTGCAGTGGVYGCPIHSPSSYVREKPKPFVQLFLKCPCCGQALQFDGYKYETPTN